MPLRRYLHDDHSVDIQNHITRLTLARFISNTALRFAIPFLGVIRRSLGVSLATMGLATSMGDFTGLLGPVVGHQLDRRSRRTTMTLTLGGVAIGAAIAASARSIVALSIGFVVLALSKLMFDNGMNSWITERTDYGNRARVVGITETAWAGATLIGIPILALVAYFTSWRVGYMVLIAALVAMSLHLRRTLPADQPTARDGAAPPLIWSLASGAGFIGFASIMAAGNCMFVAFGSWLKDAFGFSTLGLGAVSMLLGGAELLASTSTVRFTDQWGKRRSVRLGAGLMIPVSLGLGIIGHVAGLGLALLVLFFLGFEFAIVSYIPLVPSLQPNNPGAAFGIAVGLGTVGRGVTAIASTRLYSSHGIGGSGLLAAACATAALAALTLVREPSLRP